MQRAEYFLKRLVLYWMPRMALKRSFSSRRISNFVFLVAALFSFLTPVRIGFTCTAFFGIDDMVDNVPLKGLFVFSSPTSVA